MKAKRTVSLGLAAIMVGSLLTGCGAQENTDTQKNSASTSSVAETQVSDAGKEDKEPVTLRFCWWGGDERNEATIQVIDNFEKEYPWITVEPEFSGSDGYEEKLSTSLAGGQAPDIIQMGTGWLPNFVSKGDFFVDFNEYKDQMDISGFDSDFVNQYGTFNGRTVGLPTGISGQVLLVNKDLAEKIGIEFTANYTWNDLIDMGKKVQAYDKNLYLLNIDSSLLKTHVLRPYLIQLTGKAFINNETKEMSFTEDQLIETLELVKAFYDNHVTQPAGESASFKDSTQTNPKWISGGFVSAMTNSSQVDIMVNACPDTEFMVSPSMPHAENAKDSGYGTSTPQLMCVNKASANVEEAVMFLDYFFNNEEAAEILKDLRSIPPTEKARQILIDKDLCNDLVIQAVDIGLNEGSTVNEMGLTTNAEVEAVMDSMLESVMYGQSTPQEAAKSGIEMLNNILADK